MSGTGFQPRTSALAGRHPAIPDAGEPTALAQPAQGAGPGTDVPPVTEPLPVGDSAPPPPASSAKVTLNLPTDLIDDAKDAYWVERDDYPNFSGWVAAALERRIQDLMDRRELTTLPPRPRRSLPSGRPLK